MSLKKPSNSVGMLTPSIKRLIHKKQRVYNAYKKYKSHILWDKFKNLRKTVHKEMSKAKNEYLKGLVDESPRSGTATVWKRFWSHVKNIRRDSCGVATLNVGEVEISSSKGKSEVLSNQYSSVFTTEDLSEIPTIEGDPFPHYRKPSYWHWGSEKTSARG